MTDLESRLQRQLMTRADALAPKPDMLDTVRTRGRRRRLVARGLVAGTWAVAGLAVVGGALLVMDRPNDSTVVVGPADELNPEPTDELDESDEEGSQVVVEVDQDEVGPDEAVDESDGAVDESSAPALPPAPAPADEATEEPPDDVVDEPAGHSAVEAVDSADVGLIEIDRFRYAGAFRLTSDQHGASDTNYAVGALAFNPERDSLFIAGHAQHNAIAEFEIPDALGLGDDLAQLPVVDRPRQEFTTVFDRVANPDGIDRITGMYVTDGSLLVNGNNWYDASGQARDTSLVVADADALGGTVSDFRQLTGAALAAGYLSPVPQEWQDAIGGSTLTGWASNYSIISRYSVGPTLFGLETGDLIDETAGPVNTVEQMAFPFEDEVYLAPDALDQQEGQASAVWNFLSRGVYGFIVPDSRTFAVVGSNGGIDSGVGYKITQSDGTLCGGYCPYDAGDEYNYYWLFDLDEIVGAEASSDPRPYAHGRWSVPFDDGGRHHIIGGTLDPATDTLYLALSEAGQVGEFDRPPVILAYQVG